MQVVLRRPLLSRHLLWSTLWSHTFACSSRGIRRLRRVESYWIVARNDVGMVEQENALFAIDLDYSWILIFPIAEENLREIALYCISVLCRKFFCNFGSSKLVPLVGLNCDHMSFVCLFVHYHMPGDHGSCVMDTAYDLLQKWLVMESDRSNGGV